MKQIQFTPDESLAIIGSLHRHVALLEAKSKKDPKLLKRRAYLIPKRLVDRLKDAGNSNQISLTRPEIKLFHNLCLERCRMIIERTIPEYERRMSLDDSYANKITKLQGVVSFQSDLMKKLESYL